MRFLSALTLLLFSASLFAISDAKLSCLNRDGQQVAWFTLIKYPGNVTNDEKRYAYLDSNTGNEFKVINGKNCDSEGEALPNTLSGINLINSQDKSMLLFSNVPPNGTILPGVGHAKGVLAFDTSSNTGIYIIHSFLSYPKVYADGLLDYTIFEPFDFEYGQYAHCITIDKETAQKLVLNIANENPAVYYSSGIFKELTPDHSEKKTSAQEFTLGNGDQYWFLTKHHGASLNLYEDLVVPTFKQVSLAANSWGQPYQDPTCKWNHQVVNVEEITIENDKWQLWWDNSKWAVSQRTSRFFKKPEIACLCDGDRADDQLTRGGSCLCTKNAAIFNALTKIITRTDKCGKKKETRLLDN